MAVKVTPFFDYEIKVIPSNWPMDVKKQKNLIDYLERQLNKTMERFKRAGKSYHEQCEATRQHLERMLKNILSDSKQPVILPTILSITGCFGEYPEFQEVEVEYRMS